MHNHNIIGIIEISLKPSLPENGNDSIPYSLKQIAYNTFKYKWPSNCDQGGRNWFSF